MAPIMHSIRPEDFDLYLYDEEPNIYINKNDNSKWIKKNLYDFGRGAQDGFMRLTQLDFQDLWSLIFNSKIEDNRYGAAAILENEHAEELNKYILDLFNKKNFGITESMIDAFNILNLDRGINRSEIMFKSKEEVKRDWVTWKYIAQKVKKLSNERGLT